MAIRSSWRFALLLLGSGAISAALASTVSAIPPAQRPHVVIFLADDLGWREVGFNGGKTPTPNIDAIANSGARLGQFYACAQCTPTRAALLTGRYPNRCGLQSWVIHPVSTWGLPPEERTLPQALKTIGYQTYLIGKWHLGHHDPAFLPRARGFDHHYGPLVWGVDYYKHTTQGALDWRRDGKPLSERGYATHLLANEAVRVIKEHDPFNPLFMMVSFTAVHEPLQPPPEFKEMKGKDAPPLRAQVRAAMIANLDAQIGEVMAALREKKMEEKTLVIFLSDNGGDVPSGADNGDLRGTKGEFYEGGVRVPCALAWPGKIDPGKEIAEPLHIVDFFPMLASLAGARIDGGPPIDGINPLPTIARGIPSPHEEILIGCVPASAALRRGDWKLVTHHGDKPELFNLRDDPGERNNLAAAQPEKLAELTERLKVHAKESVPPKAGPADLEAPKKIPNAWGADEAIPASAPPKRSPQ